MVRQTSGAVSSAAAPRRRPARCPPAPRRTSSQTPGPACPRAPPSARPRRARAGAPASAPASASARRASAAAAACSVRVSRRGSAGFTDRAAVAFRIRLEGTADVIGADARAPCSGRALASHGALPMAFFSRQQVSVTLHSRVLCACFLLVFCSSIHKVYRSTSYQYWFAAKKTNCFCLLVSYRPLAHLKRGSPGSRAPGTGSPQTGSLPN